MAKAIDLVADVEFQSPRDDDDVKTTWILRSLTSFEFMRCTTRPDEMYERFVELGLIGWKDFNDCHGNPIEFSVENMDRIPPIVLQDISFEIQKLSVLTEDERKN